MRIARRFVDDESGMTLALAIIMIVIIGVMGAGILTFANRDLGTAAEENRGQRAFEMADAGINAAKRQLTSDCSANNKCQGHYNGGGSPDLTDNQWSGAGGGSGLTLNNLDEVASTTDNVNVKIVATSTYAFTVTSEGHYGSATRKIEAKLLGLSAGGGGGGAGTPVYYTPSAIKIEYDPVTNKGIDLRQISLFAGKDIMIQNLTSPTLFKEDYDEQNNSKNVISGTGTADELRDWDSTKAPFNPTGDWNTTGRITTTIKNNGTVETPAFTSPGFATPGKICGFTGSGTGMGDCADSATPNSVADGISSYDSTTGSYIYDQSITSWITNPNPPPNPPLTTGGNDYPRPIVKNSAGTDVARKCTFVDKTDPNTPLPTTDPARSGCYISFPFPKLTPKADVFKQRAQDATNTATDRHYWDVAADGAPDWSKIISGGGSFDRLMFVDARNSTVSLNTSGTQKGVLVVWCGRLETGDLDKNGNNKFQGIIMSLKGDGSTWGATNCATDTTKGTIRNNGAFLQAWLYAQGGSTSQAGIELGPGSIIQSVPNGSWDLLNDVFEEPVPVSFQVLGWREVYQ